MYRNSIFNPEDKLSELRKEQEQYDREEKAKLLAQSRKINNDQHKKIFHYLIDELYNCDDDDAKPMIKELINLLWKNL